MSTTKKYREFLPSELGTLLKTNWTWFLVDTGQEEPWFTDGYVAAAMSPVKTFPTEPPPGMYSRSSARRDAVAEPYDGRSLVKHLKHGPTAPTLGLIKRTERESMPNRNDYTPGIVTLQDPGDGKEYTVARHYYAWIMAKFPTAIPHKPLSITNPICFTVDDEPVVLVMLYRVPEA